LKLLKEGCVHIAGTHLRDESSGESNLPEIARMFPKNAVAVVTFAVWEEGIVTAAVSLVNGSESGTMIRERIVIKR